MAPPKASGGQVQSRLSFPTTKGGASAAAAKAKKPVVSAVAPPPAPSSTKSQPTVSKDASKESGKAQEEEVNSDEEVLKEDKIDFATDGEPEVGKDDEPGEAADIVIPPLEPTEPAVQEISSDSDEEEGAKGKAKPKGLDDLMRDRRFKDSYKLAKARVGGKLTESAAKESKAITVLRSFDLSYEYGPCEGMSRMARWQRATKLGLDPPEIICLIIDAAKEDGIKGEDLDVYEQPVFHGRV